MDLEVSMNLETKVLFYSDLPRCHIFSLAHTHRPGPLSPPTDGVYTGNISSEVQSFNIFE